MSAMLRPTQRSVQHWAAQLLQHEFVVWDTETTGLNTQTARIVQISLVNPKGKVLFNSLVHPGIPIPSETTAIHHITDYAVRNAPRFADIHAELYRLLHGQEWVIYNRDYDTPILQQECRRNGLPVISPLNHSSNHCAMKQFAAWYGTPRWQKLAVACSVFSIQVTAPAHSAVGDALSTLELVKALARC